MALRSSELMIGDWVLCDKNAQSDYEFDNVNYQPFQIRNGEDIDYAFERNMIGDADVYQPIPLTGEILEKNGFERVPQQGCANHYHWMMEKYEEESDGLLFRIKAFNTLFRGMFVSIDNPSACETISFAKQIESVHELQHALKLCGIDKTIEL